MNIKLFFIFIILLASPVYAISSTLQPSYDQGETFIAEIQGSIIEPISLSQVQFYRGHVQVPLIYDLKRFDNHYFLYAITPNSENNYTLIIKNVVTTLNGQQTTINFEQNFSTTNKTAPITISPGLIITSSSVDFTIFLNRDVPETISLSSRENSSLNLQPGQNLIHLDQTEFVKGTNPISIGKYQIIVYSTRDSSNDVKRSKILLIDPIEIRKKLNHGTKDRTFSFVITNRGLVEMPELTLEYAKDRYSLNPSRIKSLRVNESRTINITLNKEEIPFSDTLLLRSGDEIVELPLNFIYLDESNQTGNTKDPNNQTSSLYCRELNGKICSTSEICSGESINSADGTCCRGTCTPAPQSSSLAWLGYLIGAVVLIVLIIVGGRYWKARSNAKATNVIDSKIKKLEKPF